VHLDDALSAGSALTQFGGIFGIAICVVHLILFSVYKRKVFITLSAAWLLSKSDLYLAFFVTRAHARQAPLIADAIFSFLLIAAGTFLMAEERARPTALRLRPLFLFSLGTAAVLSLQSSFVYLTSTIDIIARTLVVSMWSFSCLNLSYIFLKISSEEMLAMLHGGRTHSGARNSGLDVASSVDTSIQRLIEFGKFSLLAGYLVLGLLAFTSLTRLIDDDPWRLALFAIGFSAKALILIGLVQILIADSRARNATLRARSVFEELGLVASSVEHDIRNPLSTLIKTVEVLGLRHKGIPGLQTELEVIRRQISRINSAVELIRDMQGTLRGMQSSFRFYSIERIVSEAVTTVASDAESERCSINLSLSPNVVLEIRANPERLTQAFVNIIRNAVEAYDEVDDMRDPIVTVAVGPAEGGREAVVTVRDSGKGIPPEMLKKLAQPMVSTKLSTSSDGIRGLGVFSAFRTVEMHGGNLEYESDGTSYTAVRISIPIASITLSDNFAATRKEDAERERDLQAPTNYVDGEISILLLDDDLDWGNSAKEYLESRGRVQVDLARTTEEASSLINLRGKSYYGVIVDMKLRSLRGIQYGDRWLLNNLLLARFSLKAIITGYPDAIIDTKSLKENGIEVITKSSKAEVRFFDRLIAISLGLRH
jgi:signal transduction histidine kinase